MSELSLRCGGLTLAVSEPFDSPNKRPRVSAISVEHRANGLDASGFGETPENVTHGAAASASLFQ